MVLGQHAEPARGGVPRTAQCLGARTDAGRGHTRHAHAGAARSGANTLGVGGTQAATNERADGDYDIDTFFVNNNVFAATSESVSNSHLNPSTTAGAQVLMCRCGLGGVRILPSAIDVFAGARPANWTDIDLQRQDLWSGSDWQTAFNWERNAIPGSADDAFVRHGGSVNLNTANARVENLQLSNSTDVGTQDNKLTVDSTTTIEHDSASLRPFLRVHTNGELETNDLNVNGGELRLLGGLVDVQDDLIVRETNGQAGRITGRGTIDVADSLTNGGTIRPDGGTLTFTTSNALPVWNLDGIGGAGQVDATVGDLVVNGQHLGDFDGLITIGQDRTVTFNSVWELGAPGQLIFQGGASASDAATIDGTNTTLSGPVDVDGYALMNATVTLITGATIDLAANTASGTLEINGQTTYDSGNTVGAGELSQDGNVLVTGTFSIGNAAYDWDGGPGSSDMVIAPNGDLSISASTIEPGADGGRDASVTVNGGRLSVLTSWRLDGILTLSETNGQAPVFDGVGGVTVANIAQFNVVGDATINSPVTIAGDMNVGQFGQTTGIASLNGDAEFGDTASVTIEQGSILAINGNATYRGGTHAGNGVAHGHVRSSHGGRRPARLPAHTGTGTPLRFPRQCRSLLRQHGLRDGTQQPDALHDVAGRSEPRPERRGRRSGCFTGQLRQSEHHLDRRRPDWRWPDRR